MREAQVPVAGPGLIGHRAPTPKSGNPS